MSGSENEPSTSSRVAFMAATMGGSAVAGAGLAATGVVALGIGAPIIAAAAVGIMTREFEETYGNPEHADFAGVTGAVGGFTAGAMGALVAAGIMMSASPPKDAPIVEKAPVQASETIKATQIAQTPATRAGITYKTPGYSLGG